MKTYLKTRSLLTHPCYMHNYCRANMLGNTRSILAQTLIIHAATEGVGGGSAERR